MGTKEAWTPGRRARQADIIRRVRPWEKSTGPRTDEGKRISSQNARRRMCKILRALKAYGVAQRKFLRIARQLNGGSPLVFTQKKPMFPGATRKQAWEIASLQLEMNDLQAHILALLDPQDANLEADLWALANAMATDPMYADQTKDIGDCAPEDLDWPEPY
jgi:hypothetical protein